MALAWPALLDACGRLDAALPQAAPGMAGIRPFGGRTAAWRPVCDAAAALGPAPQEDAARALLHRHLRPVALGTGLLTGYYEPELRAALAPDARFRTPLRAPPPGLGPGALLPPRAEIEAGALDGLALPLAWVEDPADAFFLQVQGSGRLRLPGGTVLRIGYAGRNGQPYRAIGRILIERGAVPREAMSMQAIRAWLAAAAPEEARALLRENPAYVFFRVTGGVPPEQGPVGTLGVPLRPGRSLAVDPAEVPLGAPVWVEARDPVDGSPIRRLAVAQDTGGAIRGRARGDLFFGWGPEAEARAGRMQDRAARFWVLLPRDDP